MSNSGRPPEPAEDDLESESKGPNLWLIYGLLMLAILGAMAFAALIVWPFYARR